jgi:hypothetical protein
VFSVTHPLYHFPYCPQHRFQRFEDSTIQRFNKTILDTPKALCYYFHMNSRAISGSLGPCPNPDSVGIRTRFAADPKAHPSDPPQWDTPQELRTNPAQPLGALNCGVQLGVHPVHSVHAVHSLVPFVLSVLCVPWVISAVVLPWHLASGHFACFRPAKTCVPPAIIAPVYFLSIFQFGPIQRFNDSTIQRFNDSTIPQLNDSTLEKP